MNTRVYHGGVTNIFRTVSLLSAFILTAASSYGFEVALSPQKTRGGQGFLLSITRASTGFYEIGYNEKTYSPYGGDGKKRIFLPVGIEARGKKKITVKYTAEDGRQETRQAWLKVTGRKKKSVRLKEKDEKIRADQPMIDEQNRLVLEKLRTRSEEQLWSGSFTAPLKAPIATKFALQRKARTYSYYHKGIDYAAPVCTPVKAVNAGRVIYAVSGLNVYGNLLMIDHGQGIVSCYFHLNKFFKKEGDMVAKGEVIAEVGCTGWATGPHLHFGLYLQGEAVDPLWWIAFTKKYQK